MAGVVDVGFGAPGGLCSGFELWKDLSDGRKYPSGFGLRP